MVEFNDFVSDEFKGFFKLYSVRLKSERGKIEYVRNINAFSMFCGSDPLKSDDDTCRRYIEHLKKRVANGELKPSTLNQRLGCLRSLRAAIIGDELVPIKRGYPIYTDNVFNGAFESFSHKSFAPATLPKVDDLYGYDLLSKDNPMDHLIFALLIKCGLTSGEILSLRRGSFNLDLGLLQVRTSSKKIRLLTLPSDVCRVASEYFAEHDFLPDSVIFFNKRGTPLRQRSLNSLVVEYSARLNLSYTPSDIRHVALACMLAGGASYVEVANYGDMLPKWVHRLEDVADCVCGAADKSILNI